MKKRLHALTCILLIFTLACCQKIGDSEIHHPEMTPPSVTVIMPETTEAADSPETTAPTTVTTPETTTTTTPATSSAETTPETTATPAHTSPETTTTTTPTTTTPAATTPTTTTPATTTTPVTTAPKPVTTVITTTPAAATAPQTTPERIGNSFAANSYNTLNYSEQKGVWLTYIELSEMLKNKSRTTFTNNINKAFDNIKELGFNTVYAQVRAYGDAYYNSSLFPSGIQYDGQIGGAMDFDPLAVMIKSAHDRGLSIHAWINPMRLGTDTEMKAVSSSYLYKQWYNDSNRRGKMVVKSGNNWYLNPAYSDCVDLISDGVAEILSNYSVDGVQIDDYFYPTTAASFDKSAYSASGTTLSLSNWRYENVNRMVKKLYNTVHSVMPDAVFGISPQGLIENNNPLYADVTLWCRESGYCDYILPQVYYGYENTTADYISSLNAWSRLVKAPGVRLVIGLAPYKIGLSDQWGGKGKNEWVENNNIISRQMADAKKLGNYGGIALYRYGSVFEPESGVASAVAAEVSLIE
jgi:uncharacterized lipoprotein YddW (UPF0748 family)